MRTPEVLASLVDEGVIEEVLRPLMSGKEAQIYWVRAAGRDSVAKIYKESQDRTFKHRASYTEGRKVRNSRDQRAIDKRSKHGRVQDEAAWRSTEVEMIYKLKAAGVRVPEPYQYIDGVLIMELVKAADGRPAPRLGDAPLTRDEAAAVYEQLLHSTVRMLCAGVVHGDLSDFNVLLGAEGPVIIDFPQAVDPSKNQNARRLLLRDVENLHRFISRFIPGTPRLPYAEEMWALYESNRLTPDTRLRGQWRNSRRKTDTKEVLELIGEANRERRRRNGSRPSSESEVTVAPRSRRIEVVVKKGATSGARPRRSRPVEVIVRNPLAGAERHLGSGVQESHDVGSREAQRAGSASAGQRPPRSGVARPVACSPPAGREKQVRPSSAADHDSKERIAPEGSISRSARRRRRRRAKPASDFSVAPSSTSGASPSRGVSEPDESQRTAPPKHASPSTTRRGGR